MIETTSINSLIEYFVTNNKERIDIIYNFINETNEKRKLLTKSTADTLEIEDNVHSIIFTSDSKEGIIGLIANTLMNKYNLPSIVLTKGHLNPNIYKGSARSKKGLAINKFLLENKDILLTSGGHEQAGGLSLEEANINKLKKRFEEYATKNPFEAEKEDYIDISITDINKDNYNFIRTLSPFGEGFKLPLLKISNIKVSNLAYSKSKLHILYPLSVNQKIIGFNYSKELLDKYDYIDIYGTLGYSIFKTRESFDFNIKRITDKENHIIN